MGNSVRSMRRRRTVFTLCTLVISLSISGVRAKGAKKGSTGGGGAADTAASCQKVYIGSYGLDTNGASSDNYVAMDNLAATSNASNPVMFDALMAKYCTALPVDGFFNEASGEEA